MRSVEIVHPERHTIRRSVGEPGELEAFETTAIHAKIAGYVKNWTVNIGATVKKGQVLAELSVPELDAELSKSRRRSNRRSPSTSRPGPRSRWPRPTWREPRRSSSKSGPARRGSRPTSPAGKPSSTASRNCIARAGADRQPARRDPQQAPLLGGRLRGVRGPDQDRRSRPDPEPSRTRFGPFRCRRRGLRHRRRQGRTPGTVEARLGYTRIEAPFDGIVTQRNVNTGDLTQPGPDRPPLFIVARSDIMTIRFNVPEAFAAEVNPGDRAGVKLQEMKGKTVEGKVTRISWAIDPKVRTLRVEIDIPNPARTFSPASMPTRP